MNLSAKLMIIAKILMLIFINARGCKYHSIALVRSVGLVVSVKTVESIITKNILIKKNAPLNKPSSYKFKVKEPNLYPKSNVNIYIDKQVNTKKTSNFNGISLRNTKNNINNDKKI